MNITKEKIVEIIDRKVNLYRQQGIIDTFAQTNLMLEIEDEIIGT